MPTARSAKVNSKDVADAAGVSRTTVSFVLNDHPNAGAIPEETRRRVLAAAEMLGYSPSPEARALRAGRSDVVICLLPNWPITGPFGVLLRELSYELHAVGLTLLLHQRGPGEDLSQVFGALTPTAVVAVGELTRAEVDLADRRGISVTSFMATVPGREDVAGLRQREIGKLQAKILIRQGHRSLAYVESADSALDWFSAPRLEGAREETNKAGGSLIHHRIPMKDAATRTWLVGAAMDGVTGICAYNDDVALALMLAASKEGLGIPEVISLVGVDDSPLSRLTTPELTTIGFRFAREAQRLAAIIVGNQEPPPRPRSSALLIVRDRGSIRPPVTQGASVRARSGSPANGGNSSPVNQSNWESR